ncbi:uncharacterized protein NEMAJ01_0330 [Nematocida major]|uniref:uncharacterized protein n=1 Tax=Nematocida major TaxID=1912982 RepID=UPI0020085710|nr:uncharacterized protein NEMAJ01_0330 [Nematocida major]KAH9385434.1 hypothetical protein NEMAJ01_0330 [Nematocida major]
MQKEMTDEKSALGADEACRARGQSENPGKWIRGERIKDQGGVAVHCGIDANTLKRIDWIEIAAQKETADKIEQTPSIFEKSFLPRVIGHWMDGNTLVLVTEPRGAPLARSLLSSKLACAAQSAPFLCAVSKKILLAVTCMEHAKIKGRVSMDGISMTEEGDVYIHNNSIWRELLGMAISETQTEEERLREVGVALLFLGTGEMLEELQGFARASDLDEERMHYKVLRQVIKIQVPCFKEVVMSLLGNPYTPRLLEETLAMHFFFPGEEQEIEPCRCNTDDYLGEEAVEDIYYKESGFGVPHKKTEEIYDLAGGVAVKASTLDRNKFTFQMHFFKSSKKVSFCFDRDADTVDSVVKEMEDEGLAQEEEIGLVKAHMEKLIIKIDEEFIDELGMGSPNEATTQSVEGAGGGHSLQAEGSEDSSDYSIKEFKDAQQISEFTSEVALCAKRAKSTADGWTELLRKQDIKTVGDLRMLIAEDWEKLELPVFASRAMKNILYGESCAPYKEKMLGIDESMKEYPNESRVEDLLQDTAQSHGRPELFSGWLHRVKCQDIRTVGELKLLREEDWEHLGLTVFSHRAIWNAIFRRSMC